MTKDEALRMAIEWLDNQQLGYSGHSVRKACQEALAETQEADLSKCPKCGGEADNGHDRCIPPSPYYCTKCNETQHWLCLDGQMVVAQLYTTPPSREWQSLSDEEIEELYGDCSIEYFRDIEAKLRKKNNA